MVHLKWLSFLFILLFLTACQRTLVNADQFQKKTKDQFRIVTYNINWGEEEFTVTAPQKTLNAIKLIDADLVLLQEVTPLWYQNIKAQLSKVYPHRAYKGDGNAGGLAVLSKYTITHLEYRNAKIGWHRAMIMTIKSPLGLLQVANFHLTPPLISKKHAIFSPMAYFLTPKIRKKEIEYYYQYLDKNKPTILAGDLNESDNGFVKKFLVQHGFTDAQAQSSDCSWVWKLGPFTLRRKLDHIFYNQGLTQTQSQILRDGNSDHYPLVVDLKK